MARTRSRRVEGVKEALRGRLRHGFWRPGDRFLSARAVAARWGVSYQTAHNLLSELEAEGLLARRGASGTYVSGDRRELGGVVLAFHPRAARAASFGERLLSGLEAAFAEAGIPARVVLGPCRGGAGWGDGYPIVWEMPEVVGGMDVAGTRRYGLVLNDRPAPGVGATYWDSIGCDDFSGGVAAGEMLRDGLGMGACAGRGEVVVVGGPAGDARSRARAAGFREVFPGARVIPAGGWFYEDGVPVAGRILAMRGGVSGVFCVNDRLAEAVLDGFGRCGRAAPPLVGFDDAPVAEARGIATVAVPVDEIVRGAVAVARERLAGDNRPALHRIYSLRPVVRASCLPLA